MSEVPLQPGTRSASSSEDLADVGAIGLPLEPLAW